MNTSATMKVSFSALSAVFLSLSLAPQRACSDELVSTTTTAQTAPTVRVIDTVAVPAPITVDVRTGKSYPRQIDMQVGQELLFKSHNGADLFTLQYHQVSQYHPADGKELLAETDRKGYKAVFQAIRPGKIRVDVDSNTLFYGLAPWGSTPIEVNIHPLGQAGFVAESQTQGKPSLAEK